MQLVHGLQSMVSHVRSFAFVSDLVEITDLFAEHPIEEALSLVVSGLSNGGVLDTSADPTTVPRWGSSWRNSAARSTGVPP